MNNYIKILLQLWMVMTIVTWSFYLIAKLETVIQEISSAKTNENFLYKCAQTKSTFKNIKDSKDYLVKYYPKYKDIFAARAESILENLSQSSTPCQIHDLQGVLLAYPLRQKNKSLDKLWPNWVVKYQRLKK